MALFRTKSRLTIKAPPPSPIPTGTGSRSAANETFQQFLESSINLPQLSLPESRFFSGDNHFPAVVDFRSLTYPGGDREAAARMLQSANDFGAFRIVNHGITGEEILSVVNEAKSVLEDCDKGGGDRIWAEEGGHREAILQVRRRNDSDPPEITVVQTETYRNIRETTEKIASKLEGIADKLSDIFSENMGDHKWGENMKKLEEKETIFSIYRYNNDQNQFERENIARNEKEKKESDGDVVMSLHIPGEHCQFFVNSHERDSFCFDAGADTIVVTVGNRLQEWSLGKLKSARSEMKFVPDLLGSQSSFSLDFELKFSNTKRLKLHHQSKIISISDQILIAFLLLSFYFIYTYLSSFFKGK